MSDQGPPKPSMRSWREDDEGTVNPDLDDPSPEDQVRFGGDEDDVADDTRGAMARRSFADMRQRTACQECGRDLFVDADVCPTCGAFQMRIAPQPRSIPPLRDRVFRLAAVLVIVGLILASAPALLRIFF